MSATTIKAAGQAQSIYPCGGPASQAACKHSQRTSITSPQHLPPSTITATTTTTSTIPPHNHSIQSSTNLDLSKESSNAPKDLLRESFFPNWKNDAASETLANPDEMQKQDPLATQIWKLYSKTKTQLPNQERMENLTWRMMAMNLKRFEREQARYESQHQGFAAPKDIASS